MIAPKFFVDTLASLGIDFYAGVPDSLLKSLCAYLTDHTDPQHRITAANEGGAVALAAGHYLATGQPACVYMQNSGIGNAVNPLLSLTDEEVYRLPVLLVIGWRGEPGIHDEPQHVKQGKLTLPLLDTMQIAYQHLSTEPAEAARQLAAAVNQMHSDGRPQAIVVSKNTFEAYALRSDRSEEVEEWKTLDENAANNVGAGPHSVLDTEPQRLRVKPAMRETETASRTGIKPAPTMRVELLRESAIAAVINALDPRTAVVSTTGMISRELFELREARGEGHARDFLTVGSMGHASQIALSIALSQPDRPVCCMDGDGAAIMHMGGLGIIGQAGPSNLLHIVLNNGAHDSVGGQPTAGFFIDLPAVARACGYRHVLSVSTEPELKEVLGSIKDMQGPVFLQIIVKRGARPDLGRPTTTPQQNRDAFMEFIQTDV